MKPPTNPEALDFYNKTLPLSTETLEIERDALYAQFHDIVRRLHIVRGILEDRRPQPEIDNGQTI